MIEALDVIFWIVTLNMIGFICAAFGLMLNPMWRKGRIGKHSLEIVGDGLIEETEYNKTEIKWKAISNISVGMGITFIRHGGADIFVVPEKDFISSERWGDYNQKLLESWQIGCQQEGVV